MEQLYFDKYFNKHKIDYGFKFVICTTNFNKIKKENSKEYSEYILKFNKQLKDISFNNMFRRSYAEVCFINGLANEHKFILDLGCCGGDVSTAMGYKNDCFIVGIDNESDMRYGGEKNYKIAMNYYNNNFKFIHANFINQENFIKNKLIFYKFSLVFFDIDPHINKIERKLINYTNLFDDKLTLVFSCILTSDMSTGFLFRSGIYETIVDLTQIYNIISCYIITNGPYCWNFLIINLDKSTNGMDISEFKEYLFSFKDGSESNIIIDENKDKPYNKK